MRTNLGWLYLLAAALCEMGFTYFLQLQKVYKYAWIGCGCCYLASGFLIFLATHFIPPRLAYPIWTGLGSVFVVVSGILLFKQTFSEAQLFFVITIVISVVGLKVLG